MAKSRPAAGGGRWVEVPPERLTRWLDGFEERHGGLSADTGPRVVLLRGAARDRRVGVLLVRLGGYACGVFEGDRLVASKVGARLVHGRSAAGGQSQQRFARRREGQVREALNAAADTAARVLAPRAGELAAFVCGGDRRAVDALRDDWRLGALFALETGPFLTVPDPRLAVLRETPARFRAVRVRLVEPG